MSTNKPVRYNLTKSGFLAPVKDLQRKWFLEVALLNTDNKHVQK